MAKKKTKKPKSKIGKAYLELNGSINIVEVKDGVKSVSPLDGQIVLKALLLPLEQNINDAVKKKPKKK